MHKSGRIIYSILFLSLCVCGCSARQSQFASEVTPTFNPITIGYSAPTQDVAQIVIMNSFTHQAKSLGWKVVTAKDNRDPVIQASQIDYLISLGVNAIVAVPEDSTKICESVKKAHAAGIPFYTIDRAPLGCEVNMTVLADNRMAGRQAGEAMVNLLKQRYGEPKGIVLELQGDLRQNVAQLRGQGFHEVIDPYQAVEVISKPTEWQASQVTGAVQEIVSSHPVDGIFLHSDCVDISVVLPILDKLGKKIPVGRDGHIFITGVDGCPEMLSAIHSGFADQSSSQPFPDFGIISLWIKRGLDKMPFDPGFPTPEGVSWPSVTVQKGETGYQLLMATTSVTYQNVDNKQLWGNQSIQSNK